MTPSAWVARRPIHQPRFRRVPATQGERRKRVGAEVDGQDLHDGEWQGDRPAGKGEDQERRHLGDGVGEDVDDELADVVVDASTSSTAPTMVAKLSSVSTIVAASRATSVPERPMATPMSARCKAGASFTPSPVTATISPRSRSASTMRSLASGELRAKTISSPAVSMCVEIGFAQLRQAQLPVMIGDPGDPIPAPSDHRRGEGMVSRHNMYTDTGTVRLSDGVSYFGPWRIEHRHDPEETQSALDIGASVESAVGLEASAGDRQESKPCLRVLVDQPGHRSDLRSAVA